MSAESSSIIKPLHFEEVTFLQRLSKSAKKALHSNQIINPTPLKTQVVGLLCLTTA